MHASVVARRFVVPVVLVGASLGTVINGPADAEDNSHPHDHDSRPLDHRCYYYIGRAGYDKHQPAHDDVPIGLLARAASRP